MPTPRTEPGRPHSIELVRALADEFKKENGSIICRELLGLDENFKPKPPEARTEGVLQKASVRRALQTAAEIFEQYEKTRREAET